MELENIIEIVVLVITVILTVRGWKNTYQANIDQARIDKKREIWVKYLMDSYLIVASGASRPDASPEDKRKFEDAMEQIQCLGTDRQIKLIKENNFDELLSDLRKELRKELGLPETDEKILHYRMGNRPN